MLQVEAEETALHLGIMFVLRGQRSKFASPNKTLWAFKMIVFSQTLDVTVPKKTFTPCLNVLGFKKTKTKTKLRVFIKASPVKHIKYNIYVLFNCRHFEDFTLALFSQVSVENFTDMSLKRHHKT